MPKEGVAETGRGERTTTESTSHARKVVLKQACGRGGWGAGARPWIAGKEVPKRYVFRVLSTRKSGLNS